MKREKKNKFHSILNSLNLHETCFTNTYPLLMTTLRNKVAWKTSIKRVRERNTWCLSVACDHSISSNWSLTADSFTVSII